MAVMHKQVKAFLKATNDEVPVELKQKIVDNIYKNIDDKPSAENLTVCPVNRNSTNSGKNPKKTIDRFTGIITNFIGF